MPPAGAEQDDRLRLLADVGSLVGSAEDYQQTLDSLARLMVRRMADWCVVDIAEYGGVRRLAVAHQDPDKIRLAQEVQVRYPSDPKEGTSAKVIASGEPVLTPLITDDDLAGFAQDETHAEALRRLGLRSAVVVPLTARGRTLGALSLVRSDESEAFTEADLQVAQEVANRAASVVDSVRLLAELSEALRLRDDFLAAVSHDMRTPLAAMLGYVQLAARRVARLGNPDARLEAYLAAAEATTQQMTDLVTDLMDVSLLRSGQPLPILLEPVRLLPLLQATLEERRGIVTDRRFTSVSEDGDLVAMADARRLRRVFDNLLDNAVKYSDPGTEVAVALGGGAPEVTVAITDEGRGIAPDEIPFIFDRFRRGSNAAGIDGAGIGLAGALEIMRQMGGDITVMSRVGAGSTFTVHLPGVLPSD